MLLGMEWYWWLFIVVAVAICLPVKVRFMKWWSKRQHEQKRQGKWGGDDD